MMHDEGTSMYALGAQAMMESLRWLLSTLASVSATIPLWVYVIIPLFFIVLWMVTEFWPIVETTTDESQAE